MALTTEQQIALDRTLAGWARACIEVTGDTNDVSWRVR